MHAQLEILNQIAERLDQGLTHFVVETMIVDSQIVGHSRVACQAITAGDLVAIVGGVLMLEPDHYLAMPLGAGVYLNQVSQRHKGTVNHSCSPNCMISGFNRLVAKRDISIGEELTIDYGGVSIGKGSIIISECLCGSANCRHTIKTDDYLLLDVNDICAYGQWMRGHLK